MFNKAEKQIIDVDGSQWRCSHDLYNAILPRLGAPEWHGKNLNALTESMIWGEINAVEPPYTLRIRGIENLPTRIAEELGLLKEAVAELREDFKSIEGRDVDVNVELLP